MLEKRAKLITRIAFLLLFALVPYYAYWMWTGWDVLLQIELLNLVPLAGIFLFVKLKKYAWASFFVVLLPLLNVYIYDEGFFGPYTFAYDFFPILVANVVLFSKRERVFPMVGILMLILVFTFTNIPGMSPRLYTLFPEHSPNPKVLNLLTFFTALVTTIIGVYFIVRNYINAGKRLKELLDKANELADLKTQFLSNMSHEIRTPLNAVIGMSNLMLEEHPRKDQKERLEVLRFSADNLLYIINDILDYSKLEAGKLHLSKKPFLLKATILHLYKSLEPQASAKGLRMILHFDDKISELLMGDVNRLVQVMNNLIQNAIKFTEKGTIRIDVNLQADGSIGFFVEDTGIGIPDDKLETIFERFSQVNTNSNRKHGGTGLGLAISNKLLELHDSKLMVWSKPGTGSRFSFSVHYEALPEADIEKLMPEIIPEHHPLHCTILLAEDNPINQLVARNFIEKWGAQVDVASNGIEAVQMAAANHYDLILMDLQMPEMDGFEATKKIRQLPEPHYKQIPIIALTASSIIEVQEEYIQAGMNNYMRKPFVPSELYQMIATYIWQPKVVNLPIQRA